MRSNDRIQTYSTAPLRGDAVSTSRFYASHLYIAKLIKTYLTYKISKKSIKFH